MDKQISMEEAMNRSSDAVELENMVSKVNLRATI
jgi:hypothetical protein